MIARSLDDTKQFKIPGIDSVEFTIKTLDSKLYKKLYSGLSQSRVLINKLDSVKLDEYQKLKAANPEKFDQAEAELHEAFAAFVRHGIGGHTGLTNKQGEEIPFKADGNQVSKDTMEQYELQRWIVPLAFAVQGFNGVTEEERKNS